MSTEREDLDDLERHPGWLRVVTYATQHWMGEFDSLVQGAVNVTDDGLAMARLRQVIAAKRAVEDLLAWPRKRVKDLSSRREDELTGPSIHRRGAL